MLPETRAKKLTMDDFKRINKILKDGHYLSTFTDLVLASDEKFSEMTYLIRKIYSEEPEDRIKSKIDYLEEKRHLYKTSHYPLIDVAEPTQQSVIKILEDAKTFMKGGVYSLRQEYFKSLQPTIKQALINQFEIFRNLQGEFKSAYETCEKIGERVGEENRRNREERDIKEEAIKQSHTIFNFFGKIILDEEGKRLLRELTTESVDERILCKDEFSKIDEILKKVIAPISIIEKMPKVLELFPELNDARNSIGYFKKGSAYSHGTIYPILKYLMNFLDDYSEFVDAYVAYNPDDEQMFLRHVPITVPVAEATEDKPFSQPIYQKSVGRIEEQKLRQEMEESRVKEEIMKYPVTDKNKFAKSLEEISDGLVKFSSNARFLQSLFELREQLWEMYPTYRKNDTFRNFARMVNELYDFMNNTEIIMKQPDELLKSKLSGLIIHGENLEKII